jgi:serine/threonine-protein kinase
VAAPFQPELFGDFLLVQRLARRAMAESLLAVRLGDRSGRAVVVKRPVLGERASGRAAQAILREAEVLAAVRAPELPALEAHGELAGLPYVAVEHVRGVTLDALLAPAAPLPPAAVRAVAIDLARALAALHAAGFVHGDVTTSNVIVDDAGEARLLDLGIARRVGEAREEEIAGTAGYLAPEAALPGEAQPAQDVYGWGVVVAECALGQPLFQEHDLVEAANRGGPPRKVAAWDEHVPSLSAALARDPAARPSLEAVIKALEALPREREALAERVERVARSESAALTPTAPMGSAAPAPTLMDHAAVAATVAATAPVAATVTAPVTATVAAPATVSATAPATVSAPVSAAAYTSRRVAWSLALVLIGIVFFLAGNLVARAQLRNRPATLSLGGALPRRAQLELDGKRVAPPVDGRLNLTPGDHTLAILLPKGTRREYTFHVRPSETIIVVTQSREKGGTTTDTEAEEREP